MLYSRMANGNLIIQSQGDQSPGQVNKQSLEVNRRDEHVDIQAWQRTAKPLHRPISLPFQPNLRKQLRGYDGRISNTRCHHAQSAPLTQLGIFSAELWLMVLEYLPKPALRRVSQLSRCLWDLAIPILFRTINLSINLALDTTQYKTNLPWRASLQTIVVKQWCFAQQLLSKPEYASYVRSFTWTMGLENMRRLPKWVKDKQAIWNPDTIYSIFALLDKVKTVNIDTGTGTPDFVPPLPPLFPAAEHICLGGNVHYNLASSILHGDDKAPLRSLTINNVFEGGLLCGGEIFRCWRAISEGNGWPTHKCPHTMGGFPPVLEDWPAYSLPAQFTEGCIERLLTSAFQRRCQRLAFLCLRKQGQQHPYQGLPSTLSHDHDVYREWATLLHAVHPSALLIVHGGHILPPCRSSYLRRSFVIPQSPEIASMDTEFEVTLLPTLKEGWSGLEKMEIRGVDRRVLGDLQDQDGVALEVDEIVEECSNEVYWSFLDD